MADSGRRRDRGQRGGAKTSILFPSPMLSASGPSASRAYRVRLCQGRHGRHAPAARSRSVGQPVETGLDKPLRPLVDKPAADSDGRSHRGNRHLLREEEDNPSPSGTPGRHGGGALPRQECVALGRCEPDRQSGFASTSHIETSQAGDDESCGHVRERTHGVLHGPGHHMLFKEKSHTAYHPGGHTHREQKALFRVGNLLTGESERRLKGEALRKGNKKVAVCMIGSLLRGTREGASLCRKFCSGGREG